MSAKRATYTSMTDHWSPLREQISARISSPYGRGGGNQKMLNAGERSSLLVCCIGDAIDREHREWIEIFNPSLTENKRPPF